MINREATNQSSILMTAEVQELDQSLLDLGMQSERKTFERMMRFFENQSKALESRDQKTFETLTTMNESEDRIKFHKSKGHLERSVKQETLNRQREEKRLRVQKDFEARQMQLRSQTNEKEKAIQKSLKMMNQFKTEYFAAKSKDKSMRMEIVKEKADKRKKFFHMMQRDHVAQKNRLKDQSKMMNDDA